MSKLIASNPSQLVLLPSSFGCLLPADHQAHFFNRIIEELDLSAITSTVDLSQRRGRPAYDPVMMTKLVMYAYSVGISSSRDMEQACVERIDFRMLAGNRRPDYRSIARFRKRHAGALSALHEQTLLIAASDGLVDMQEVATDGTKILANASKHKAMSYERMCEKELELKAEIKCLKKESHSGSRRHRQTAKEDLQFKQNRLRHIRKWKKALEERASAEGKQRPEPTDQINFTDSESRIMKVEKQFEQAYNAQAAVDKRNQIVLAAMVTQDRNDKRLLEAMLDRVAQTTGLLPDNSLFDAGYFSEAQILTVQQKYKTQLLVPPDRQCYGEKLISPRGRMPKNISTADRMRRKLQTKSGRTLYGHRKTIVEPVFGQIKTAGLQFTQFSCRGLQSAQHEWGLVCAVHNLLKIYRHRRSNADHFCFAA